MDRPIPKSEQARRKWAPVVALAVAVVAVALAARIGLGLFQASLARDELLTGMVDRGDVAAAIETTGSLTPEREIALAAPADTRVLRVLRQPGARLAEGEPILALDVAALELERETLAQKLASLENDRRQTVLGFRKQENEDRGKLELIELDLRFLEARHRQQKLLRDKGLASLEALQQAELELEKKRVEKRQLEDARVDAAVGHEAELEGLRLELALTRKALARAEERLEQGAARAPAAGVLTWVVEAEGSAVRAGEPLARIADLSRFKASAKISDFYADRISEGQPAMVRVGNQELAGRVIRLLPEVADGALGFEAAFDQGETVDLRPNQRVDVFLQTQRRQDVLRVRRGPALVGPGRAVLFLIRGDKAVRTTVEVGVFGAKYIEIIAGLAEGDEVILNDLSEYAHRDSIKLK